MARLGRTERHLRRVAIANLPDQHDVRILTQAVLEPVEEGIHVAPHLALSNDRRTSARIDVFDRLFDRDDPASAFVIEQIDEKSLFPNLYLFGAAQAIQHRPPHLFSGRISQRMPDTAVAVPPLLR